MDIAEEVTVDWRGSSVLCPWGQGGERIKDYLQSLLGDEGRGSLHPSTCLPLGRKATHLEGPFLPSLATPASVLGSRTMFHDPDPRLLFSPTQELTLVQERDEWRAAVSPCVGLSLQQK